MMSAKLCLLGLLTVISSGWGDMHDYKYYGPDKYVCVRIQTDISINITYETKDGSRVETVAVPDFAGVDGGCGLTDSKPYISFSQPPDDSPLQSLDFSFSQTTQGLAQLDIVISYDPSKLNQSVEKSNTVHTQLVQPLILSNVNHSYYCNVTQTYALGSNVKLLVDSMHAQGFHMVKGDFSPTFGDVCNAHLKTATTENMPLNVKTTKRTTSTTKTTVKTTPIPTPLPTNHTYSVGDGKEKCLMLRAAIKLQIAYGKNQTLDISIPANLTVSGSCHNDSETLILSWKDKMAAINISFTFMSTKNNMKFSMNSVSLSYILFQARQKTVNSVSARNLTEFSTKVGDYYMCNNVTKISLDGATLEMEYLQLQGFRDKNSTDFYGRVNDCQTNSPGKPTSADPTVGDPLCVFKVTFGVVIIVVPIVFIMIRRRRVPRTGYKALR